MKKFRTVEDLKVGDVVHYTDVNYCHGKELQQGVVAKIGTKLITVNRWNRELGKFYKATLGNNDDYSHLNLVVDANEFLESKKIQNILFKIKNVHLNVKDLTLENVIQAAKLLNINLD